MLKQIVLTLTFASLALGYTLTATAKPTLVSNMQAYLVQKTAEGKEYRTPARQTIPGQILEYNLTYTNQMKKPLSGLIVSGPIPANTTYVAGSAKTQVPHSLLVSIDGGATFESEPVRRSKRQANGEMKTYIVPPEKYTNIRWKVAQPISSLGKQLYSYRVKVK